MPFGWLDDLRSPRLGRRAEAFPAVSRPWSPGSGRYRAPERASVVPQLVDDIGLGIRCTAGSNPAPAESRAAGRPMPGVRRRRSSASMPGGAMTAARLR